MQPLAIQRQSFLLICQHAKKNIPTKKIKKKKKTWLSGQNKDRWWEEDFKKKKTRRQSPPHSLMLSKKKRLNLKKDFKWVAAGKRLETPYLKLFIKLGDNHEPRVGIALSARSFPKAVGRNRARRITSAAFEALYSSLPQNTNILALPKAGVIAVKSGDLLLDLEAVLKNAKIIT